MLIESWIGGGFYRFSITFIIYATYSAFDIIETDSSWGCLALSVNKNQLLDRVSDPVIEPYMID